LLPGAGWAVLHAAAAWLTADPRPPTVPAVLAEPPDDGSAAEWALLRLMAGLPVDLPRWQRALDAAAGRDALSLPSPWFVFQGSHRLLDLATALSVLGQREQAARHLDTVAAQLDALERQGNRWHALALHRARVAALRGQPDVACTALEAAVQAGSRHGWWLRLDPALAGLRAVPRFHAVLDGVARRVAAQRRQVGGS